MQFAGNISFAWIGVIALLVYYYFLNGKVGCGDDGHYGPYHLLLCTWIAFPAPTTFSFILFLILFIGGVLQKFMAITPLCLVVELILALGLGKCFDLEEPTQTAPTYQDDDQDSAAATVLGLKLVGFHQTPGSNSSVSEHFSNTDKLIGLSS